MNLPVTDPHSRPVPHLITHPCHSMPPTTSYSDVSGPLSRPLPPPSHSHSSLFLPPPTIAYHTPIFPPGPPSSLPFSPPYHPPVIFDHPPSFSLTLTSPSHPALIKLSSTSFAPLRSWLPWLDWDGSWLETHPMQTTARCPIDKLGQTISVLQQKGFKQTRVSHQSVAHTHLPIVPTPSSLCADPVIPPCCCDCLLQNMLMARF
jgi:hypothetical protein